MVSNRVRTYMNGNATYKRVKSSTAANKVASKKTASSVRSHGRWNRRLKFEGKNPFLLIVNPYHVLNSDEVFEKYVCIWSDEGIYSEKEYHVSQGVFVKNYMMRPDVISPRLHNIRDSVVFSISKRIYSLRRMAKKSAEWLLSNRRKIHGFAEKIIGYVETLSGKVYGVFKVMKAMHSRLWSLGVSDDGSNSVDVNALSNEQKHLIYHGITDKLTELYASGFSVNNIQLRNMGMTEDKIVLLDPRMAGSDSKKGLSFADAINNVLELLFGHTKTKALNLRYVYHTYRIKTDTTTQ